jgi:hypothetical protein
MSRNYIGSNINDGFYEILFRSDGVYLSVYPPEANGRRLEAKDVIDCLNKKMVKNFDKDIVILSSGKLTKLR